MKNYQLAKLIAIPIIFIINLVIAPHYTSGDQEFYREVYNAINNLNLFEGYRYYITIIQSGEFVHYLFTWVGSYLEINKDFYFSLFNIILAYLFLCVCQNNGVSVWVALNIVLTNFYFYVLYFAAERLKVAFLFFILSILISNRAKYSIFSAVVSILTHAQMLIIYFSLIFARIFNPILKGKLSKSSLYSLFFIPFIFITIGDHIYLKFIIYYDLAISKGIDEIYKIILFFALTIYYAQKKFFIVLIFLPLMILIPLIGGDRVNIFGYFIFIFYALKYNKGVNAGIILTSFYYTLQTIPFVFNIITKANGFAES